VEILLLDSLIPEADAWLKTQHTVHYQPQWADDPSALRKGAYKANAMVLPRHVVVNREFLDFAPKLQAIARLHAGSDNTDLEACRERDVRVIQPTHANIRSNAEFLLGSLLLLYRRGVVSALAGVRRATVEVGRELAGSTVGLLGLAPTAHTLAAMLSALGVRLIGYDPAIHSSSEIWARLQIEPVTLAELTSRADAVSMQMLYASRFEGFIGAKVLATCKKGQLWVGTSRSSLFDPQALAAALSDGRIEACMLDGAEAGFAGAGSPLRGVPNLYLTPRLGSLTHEARMRASWYVAHRTHETLAQARVPTVGRSASRPADLEMPANMPLNSSYGEPDFIIR
jgi:phosphoglycerate dehydrogenase-like enzyme